MTNTEKLNQVRECDSCPTVGIVKFINKMWLCETCYAKELMTNEENERPQETTPEIPASDEPINERLKRAYIDKTNEILVGGMTPQQLNEHLADLEDHIKVFNVYKQAVLDINEQWARNATSEERENLRKLDLKYRAKARPNVKSDGTLKDWKAKDGTARDRWR